MDITAFDLPDEGILPICRYFSGIDNVGTVWEDPRGRSVGSASRPDPYQNDPRWLRCCSWANCNSYAIFYINAEEAREKAPRFLAWLMGPGQQLGNQCRPPELLLEYRRYLDPRIGVAPELWGKWVVFARITHDESGYKCSRPAWGGMHVFGSENEASEFVASYPSGPRHAQHVFEIKHMPG